MYCDFTCPAVNHRMFVLESSGSDIWSSDYKLKAELDTYDQFAIDGTYFQHESGLYHIYSCWYDGHTSWPAMLCITKSRLLVPQCDPTNVLAQCQTPGPSPHPSQNA